MFTINQSVNLSNFYDETDADQFISQLSPPSPLNTQTQNHINTQNHIKIIQDQFRQSQECLETSAAYMKEIDNFFRELASAPRAIDTPSVTSTLSFDTFDLSCFSTQGQTDDADVIDPAVIFNIDQTQIDNINNYADADTDDTDIDEPIYTFDDDIYYDQTDQQLGFLPFQKKQRISSTRLRNNANSANNKSQKSLSTSSSSLNSSNTSSSASSFGSPKSSKYNTKVPKFYSRSGQVADPNRGPCHNCHTTLTCYWRKLDGLYYCNACTLFYKRNNEHRNVKEIVVDKPIKRRNRKSKYSEL